ncbi:TNF receptor-associated factor 4-like [Halichondria panicea]|uniref:TNF receptor-associated factor 4-like n=1 Tax=Halichondria panicea TaxID=6063 RepID=UPI00312BA511
MHVTVMGHASHTIHNSSVTKKMAALNPDNQQQADKRIIGFDCEFVKPPPSEYIQSQCPVCLQIIREPHQVTCCGKKFCKACIEHIKAIKKSCPTCNKNEFLYFPDTCLKQSLYGLNIRCGHQKDGCEWTGELRQLDEHLNTDPEPEKQLDGCKFVKFDCIYRCGNHQQRRYIQNHRIKDCPKRLFDCEHCQDYKSTYDNVTNNHWPVCGSFPVPCPNQCGSTIQRQNIDSHVANECPLATINCDFHHVGCAVKLPRQDMPEHLRENLLTHISLLATSHTKQQAEITNLKAENDTLKRKHKNFGHNYQYLEAENRRLKTKLEPLQQLLKTAPPIVNSRPPIVNSRPLGPPVLTLTNFQQHKRDGDEWFSPSVYTHHQGYKICLKVYANGYSTGKGTHVSVGVYFMRGEFDDSLKWPFRGVISWQLMDQVNGEDHSTHTTPYSDKIPNTHCNKVTKGERSKNGLGLQKFIAHTELEPKYLRNDTLLFQIHKIELKK